MSVNPFEPPRAGDTAVAQTSTANTLPEAALGELVASAPWVRWASRLALVSIAVSALNSAVSLARTGKMAEKIGAAVGILIGVPVAILFVMMFRRYAGHLEALRERRAGSLPGVVDGQRSLMKAFGILMIVFIVLIPLLVLAGVAAYVVMKGRR